MQSKGIWGYSWFWSTAGQNRRSIQTHHHTIVIWGKYIAVIISSQTLALMPTMETHYGSLSLSVAADHWCSVTDPSWFGKTLGF